ncbi:hypothetical protein BD769DRAFT_1387361 [Suillus cothurnatus]|nr:hypothetical protein BD769DRAFT_1387361 [Suillus cothurnatus]
MTVNVESEDEQNVDTLTVPHVAVDANLTVRSSGRKKGSNCIIESEDNEEYHRTTTAKASQADLAVCHGGIVSDEGNASEVPDDPSDIEMSQDVLEELDDIILPPGLDNWEAWNQIVFQEGFFEVGGMDTSSILAAGDETLGQRYRWPDLDRQSLQWTMVLIPLKSKMHDDKAGDTADVQGIVTHAIVASITVDDIDTVGVVDDEQYLITGSTNPLSITCDSSVVESQSATGNANDWLESMISPTS